MAPWATRAGVWAGEATRGHVGPRAEELLDRHGARQNEGTCNSGGESHDVRRIKLTAGRRALEQGIGLSGSSQRVEGYLARWLEDSVRPSVRWNTHRAYSLCMRRLFPLVGYLRLGH
jgi:hypothetical protein